MNVLEVQRRLFFEFRTSKMLMPNYTPFRWYECDMLRITQNLYFYEYEIKNTLSDFKADSKKSEWDRESKTTVSKHDLLLQKSDRGPSRFYYIVPPDLVEKVGPLLPPFAGLISFNGHLHEIQKAPLLHSKKFGRSALKLIHHRAYNRYLDLLLRFPDAQRIQHYQEELSNYKSGMTFEKL
jgi:hypothetical protein